LLFGSGLAEDKPGGDGRDQAHVIDRASRLVEARAEPNQAVSFSIMTHVRV
jgi:hypothetical protein